jgi:hypothetical protein
VVSCVRTAPMVMPKEAPTGAPAEKVAKAKDRIREGGNAWARMPSWVGMRLCTVGERTRPYRRRNAGGRAGALKSTENVDSERV